MATIREYFDTDSKSLTAHDDWTYAKQTGEVIARIRAKIALDLEANAPYWRGQSRELTVRFNR